MLLTILAFAVVAGVIITIHEFGHFLAARLTGMRVVRFSIGFPPRFYSWKRGDTEYTICWIPLGGFVRIAGMVDESLDESVTGAPDEFMSKNAWQKTFVMSAGVLMNYVTAFLLIAGLTVFVGMAETPYSRIGEVLPDNPAAVAGVRAGDEIFAVNGMKTSSWEDVVKAISGAGDTITLELKRGSVGEQVNLIVPTKGIEDGKGGKRRVIGIVPQIVYRSATVGDVIGNAWSFCYETTAGIVGFLLRMARGEGSLSQIQGPLGVAKMSGDSAREGPGAFLFFIAFVSVSIAFMNILPFPALDGGHIVYVLIEAVIRRPIPSRVKIIIQQVGMALLLLLVLVVSYHDIIRIIAN